MNDLPVIIHKSLFGYVVIVISAIFYVAVITALTILLLTHGLLTLQIFYVLGFLAILILLGSIIRLWVYELSIIKLTSTGVTVTNWLSLFRDQQSELEWSKVQDATSRQAGFFSEIVGYGTLIVQTAGTETNFTITMIPDVQHWAGVISDKASATPELVKTVS